MNKAFVKDDENVVDVLPDREIPPGPNYVTPEGLAQIERMQAQLTEQLAEAEKADDRDAAARIARDLRYWTARRSNAQLMPEPADKSHVAFGSKVTIERDDGRKQTFRIVGQDEADPDHGTLSYVSPLAQALMGKGVGDTIRAGTQEAEVRAIG